jgi:hypothetical protein
VSLDAFIVSNRNVYLEGSMHFLGIVLIYEFPCVNACYFLWLNLLASL